MEQTALWIVLLLRDQIDQTSAITSQLIRIQSRFADSVCVCVRRRSWPHQAMTHMIPSVWYKCDLLRCMHEWAFKIKHLTTTRTFALTLKPSRSFVTRLLYSRCEQRRRLLVSRWPRISSLPFYFQALGGGPCSYEQALHGVAFGLAPAGPRLGAESWSAASLECQTFEVRLVKKERRLVGVWPNRPLCLK